MNQPAQLLARLAEIGQSLAARGEALALLGLGSVGLERDRLDAYSDLDFFVIAKPGTKASLLADLGWLGMIAPIAYYFRNTVDGYKLLFADGIFCEFAIFEQAELFAIPFAPGQVVWHAPDYDPAFAQPRAAAMAAMPQPQAWQLGEALTNLYVGLGRFRRGEKLSAARFIQQYAVDRVLDLTPEIESSQTAHADQFAGERRYEQRFPTTASLLPSFMQGYDRSPESAAAILAFLEQHFEINPAIAQAIRTLITS